MNKNVLFVMLDKLNIDLYITYDSVNVIWYEIGTRECSIAQDQGIGTPR